MYAAADLQVLLKIPQSADAVMGVQSLCLSNAPPPQPQQDFMQQETALYNGLDIYLHSVNLGPTWAQSS